jgi:hypothetical protein
MTVPAPIADAVGNFLRAQLTGDLELLKSVCVPHPDLALLVSAKPPAPTIAPLVQELRRLQVSGFEIGHDRFLARPYLGGVIHVMLVHLLPEGPRVDPRFALAALQPDDECRRVARRFYLALLLGDGETLAELAFDTNGVDVLVHQQPPAGEQGQLEHVAETMGLARLQQGDPFLVPKGIEFVCQRHAELGIEVFSALLPDGECTFMLRKRDGAWKVIPFHFIQAVIVARGGSLAV